MNGSQSSRSAAAETASASGSEAMAIEAASQANTSSIFSGLRARLELAFTAQLHELRGDVELAARCRQLMRDPELLGVAFVQHLTPVSGAAVLS